MIARYRGYIFDFDSEAGDEKGRFRRRSDDGAARTAEIDLNHRIDRTMMPGAIYMTNAPWAAGVAEEAGATVENVPAPTRSNDRNRTY